MAEIAARIQRLNRISAAFVAVATLGIVVAGAIVGRALTLRDAVLPGVRVAGLDVGGLHRDAARSLIASDLRARLSRPMRVELAGTPLRVVPADVFRLDVAATERRAYEAGRDSVTGRLTALVAPFASAHAVEPLLTVRSDARARLFAAAYAATERPVPARIRLADTTPVVIPAQAGTTISLPALLAAVEDAALAGRQTVRVEPVPLAPALGTRDAERAAAGARALLAAPVVIEHGGEELGRLAPGRLARLLRFVGDGGSYRLALDRKRLAAAVQPLAEPFLRKPVDAGFRAKGKRVRVVAHRPGTRVDAAMVEAAIVSGTRPVPLALTTVAPEFTTQEAYALGIRERVSTFTTDMGESSPNRIWNVQLLGRYLDGKILRPGETFSYNKIMGPRTIERGFREGQMIWNGVLIPSIGGGVCQTATTIFNAAFEAGLPIKDRLNHSFYISHYPLGRDATVSWGGPDLVFKNDLRHAILIKARGNAKTFTVSFYGTKQGRRVVARTSAQTNWRTPQLQYAIDPSAPPGSVRTTGGGGPGFDVTVYRKVFEDGKLLRRDRFVSRYTPENPTAIYGPGATPPGPYFYLPSSA